MDQLMDNEQVVAPAPLLFQFKTCVMGLCVFCWLAPLRGWIFFAVLGLSALQFRDGVGRMNAQYFCTGTLRVFYVYTAVPQN